MAKTRTSGGVDKATVLGMLNDTQSLAVMLSQIAEVDPFLMPSFSTAVKKTCVEIADRCKVSARSLK